ncbi:MAG: PfkB family carbohydrate kinase, partial [Steroidobacteraceae bacterium]
MSGGKMDLKARLRKARVLVVGDAMLDRYLFGEVERISPEAPVPVVRVTREEHRLGGAANVALNVKALGPGVTLVTVVGQDEPARTLEGLLKTQAVEVVLGR